MDLSLIEKLTPETIQQEIDARLRAAGVDRYVDYVRYVPQGQELPADATHVLSLASQAAHGEAVYIAIKAKGLWRVLADAVLAVV